MMLTTSSYTVCVYAQYYPIEILQCLILLRVFSVISSIEVAVFHKTCSATSLWDDVKWK